MEFIIGISAFIGGSVVGVALCALCNAASSRDDMDTFFQNQNHEEE